MSSIPSPNLPIYASPPHEESHSAIRWTDTHRLSSPGRSFYLIRDWQTQRFQLSKKEEFTAITGLVGPEQLTYAQYIDTVYVEDQAGFAAMEHHWQRVLALQPATQLPRYRINFDYRVKMHNQETVRLLHQIIHLGIDESGIVRYSVERCTDISLWKRYGPMVLTLLGPAFATPYHFRPDSSKDPTDASPLTKTEKRVVQLLVEGKSSKEIASHLDITFNTANTHRRNILRKTEVKNTVELVKYALQYEHQ